MYVVYMCDVCVCSMCVVHDMYVCMYVCILDILCGVYVLLYMYNGVHGECTVCMYMI